MQTVLELVVTMSNSLGSLSSLSLIEPSFAVLATCGERTNTCSLSEKLRKWREDSCLGMKLLDYRVCVPCPCGCGWFSTADDAMACIWFAFGKFFFMLILVGNL